MKKRVLVGMTALLLSLSLLMAQEIPAGVITAFKRGSSQELSKYMGDKVNLVLQGRSQPGIPGGSTLIFEIELFGIA